MSGGVITGLDVRAAEIIAEVLAERVTVTNGGGDTKIIVADHDGNAVSLEAEFERFVRSFAQNLR